MPIVRPTPLVLFLPLVAAPLLGQAATPTIPLIDLDAETDRQVIVDREAGQYLGHPTTLLLEDGRTLLVVYPKGHGAGAILLKRSTDGGRTWSSRLPTPASWATSRETPTLHRVIDATGRRRIILFSGLHPVRMSVSEDDGRTWSDLAPVGNWGGIVAMASVLPLRTGAGHYIALFHDDGRFITGSGVATDTFTVYASRSTDGGMTWDPPSIVARSNTLHLSEPGAIRSPDGTQIAVLLRENRRRAPAQVIFSDDEGATWTAPQPLAMTLTGDRHVARYAPDGRLFISFRDLPPEGTESATRGDWVGWVGQYEDLQGGGAGSYRIRLKDNHHPWDNAYPGVEVLEDGTFVVTTYGYWTEGEEPYILSVRFTLDELDRRLVER